MVETACNCGHPSVQQACTKHFDRPVAIVTCKQFHVCDTKPFPRQCYRHFYPLQTRSNVPLSQQNRICYFHTSITWKRSRRSAFLGQWANSVIAPSDQSLSGACISFGLGQDKSPRWLISSCLEINGFLCHELCLYDTPRPKHWYKTRKPADLRSPKRHKD